MDGLSRLVVLGGLSKPHAGIQEQQMACLPAQEDSDQNWNETRLFNKV
jgi:hypothetical protein